MKLYLSARYGRKGKIAELAKRIASENLEVVSTWHLEPYPENVDIADVPEQMLTVYAVRDLDEVAASDGLVFFSETEAYPRGGRHVEFGIALALKKLIFVVGQRENGFHYVPWVRRFDDLDTLINYLKGKR